MPRSAVALALPLLCASASAHASPASELLAAAAARHEQTRELRGTFEQIKRVALFRSAVRSSGRFVVKRAAGKLELRWITDKPSPSELRFDGKHVELRAPGATTRRVDIARAPRFGALVQDLVAFLGAGGAKTLGNRYTVSGDPKTRRIELVPRDASLKKRIERVTLTLEANLATRALKIDERSGDSTHITLHVSSRR
ncbi:MAG: outer membrane lipoprotein carrier protein LolA [Myxococcales bacterium]|nr:outer membrane lipoprotein carrier protein LolA [Myxococcales bacterium]